MSTTHPQAKAADVATTSVEEAYKVDGNPVGSVRISDGAISTIVKRATLSVDGVARLAGSTLIDDLAELVRSKRIQDRAIQIEHTDRGSVITIAINPYFGYKIPVLIAEIQRKITESVQSMTGIPVEMVNVAISGIEERPQTIEE